MNENRLDSLIMLLDDPDTSVFSMVQDELLKEEVTVVNHLERVWETSLDELVQKRIELIIRKIQLNDTKEKIKNWANQDKIDLFEGFFLISRQEYPELKLKYIQQQLEKIRKDIWLEFRNSLTSLEKITILNHIFYHHYRFKIDKNNGDLPQHSYLNRVLDTRKGNPVSIAILYLLVGRLLQLPLHYIDFQDNPLIGYFDQDIARLSQENTDNAAIFYINTSNQGAIIGPKELDYIQHPAEPAQPKKTPEPCSDRTIIKRLAERLALSYQQIGNTEKVTTLNEIIHNL